MSDKKQEPLPLENTIPVAEIRPARRFSITWVVPLVAVLVAGWLIYTTLAAKGPTITISFLNAEGLEPGKTKIKYKEVEIGTVKDIAIAKNLNGVIVTAELRRDTEKYLTDQTNFWITRAHVSAKEIRDLGTLLSGAYISVDPVIAGKPQKDFIGLERPPAVSISRPGRFFILSSESLGSLSIGSPVHYRQIEVGQVTDYRLKPDRSGVLIDVFIGAPFHDLVRKNSHFWNASGMRIDVNTTGIEIRSDSLLSVFLGGVSFDSPLQNPTEPAMTGATFQLYQGQKKIRGDNTTPKTRFLAYFTDSVRGLAPGASVEFKGIRVGEVEKIIPEIDALKGDFRVKTILAIAPDQIAPGDTAENIVKSTLPRLISKGLRAQLATDNFLTGKLYVDLDFHEDSPSAEILSGDPYPQFPTTSSTLAQTTASISRILKNLEQIPLDKIGEELSGIMRNLNKTLDTMQITLDSTNQELSPAIVASLEQFQKTTLALQTNFDGDSALQYRLQELLQELQMTSRSLKTLTDYLERKPQSIIFGKDEVQP